MNEGAKAADSGKAARKASRGRRLSVALRENLKRRKAQAKGRLAAGASPPTPHDSAGIGADNQSERSIASRPPGGDD
jgi:hypothetical protein